MDPIEEARAAWQAAVSRMEDLIREIGELPDDVSMADLEALEHRRPWIRPTGR